MINVTKQTNKVVSFLNLTYPFGFFAGVDRQTDQIEYLYIHRYYVCTEVGTLYSRYIHMYILLNHLLIIDQTVKPHASKCDHQIILLLSFGSKKKNRD